MDLMTPEEYRKTEWPVPYVLRLKGKTSTLYYFGETHSHDQTDTQWNKVKTLWHEFLTDSSPKKIVLVEGGLRDPQATEAASIINDGGMGLVSFLAREADIEIKSPEPSERAERNNLLKEFSKDEIAYYYFARMVHQWLRLPAPKPDFEKYMSFSLARDSQVSAWDNYDFSVSHMKVVHESFFGKPFLLENSDIFYDAINPMAEKRGRINQVSAASGRFRDEYIVDEITRYLKEGYTIYAQFGFSHVVVQEKLLRERIARM